MKPLTAARSQAADPTLGTWWNYLRRQLYVMDTYASAHNRRVNHTMLALHAYLSWAAVAPLATGVQETSMQDSQGEAYQDVNACLGLAS